MFSISGDERKFHNFFCLFRNQTIMLWIPWLLEWETTSQSIVPLMTFASFRRVTWNFWFPWSSVSFSSLNFSLRLKGLAAKEGKVLKTDIRMKPDSLKLSCQVSMLSCVERVRFLRLSGWWAKTIELKHTYKYNEADIYRQRFISRVGIFFRSIIAFTGCWFQSESLPLISAIKGGGPPS